MSNFLRLFTELRLSPWLPEHNTFIKSRLAALEIEDPTDAVRYRLEYARIHAAYLAQHPEEAIAPLPEEIKETLHEAKKEEKKEDKPKKKVK